jgi:hypothetical protein
VVTVQNEADKELQLLGMLCRALAKQGLGVQLRDALPGLTVTRRPDISEGTGAYVMVNPSRLRFAWWRVDNSHPVSDIDGAAMRIAAFVREQPSAAGHFKPSS